MQVFIAKWFFYRLFIASVYSLLLQIDRLPHGFFIDANVPWNMGLLFLSELFLQRMDLRIGHNKEMQHTTPRNRGKNTHNTLGMFKIAIKNHRLFHMFRSVGKSSWVIYFNGPCTKPAKALRPSEDAKTQQGLTQQEQQEQQDQRQVVRNWSRLVFASRRIYVAILAAGTIDLYPLATAPSLYVSLYLSTNLPIYPCIHSSIRPSGHPIDLIYLIDLIYPISPICHIYPIYVLYPILSTLSILSALSMLSMLLIIHAWAF